MFKYLPFIALSLLLIVVTFLHVNQVIQTLGGYFYPLDDTYIHLAIADHFFNHGIWGVTKHGFTSSSSSPLYALLIAGFAFLPEIYDYIPLLINTLLALSLFWILFQFAIIELGNYVWGVILIVGIYIAAPLNANIYNGMEHLLHTTLSITFLIYYLKYIRHKTHFRLLIVLAFLLVSVRYESIFLIITISLMDLFEKRFKNAIMMMLMAALPIFIYGIISVTYGDLFLPNSILLKGDAPKGLDSLIKLPWRIIVKFIEAPHLSSLFALSCSYVIFQCFKKNTKTEIFKLHFLVSATVLMHLAFAKTGWVYRYESYLMAMYILTFVISLKYFLDNFQSIYKRISIILIMVILLVPSFTRFIESVNTLPTMSKNIHDQQIQMSKFLQSYYNKSSVVLNDIGACSYFTDIQLTDLIGIADRDVIQLRIKKDFNKHSIEQLSRNRGAEIALVYADGFAGLIPDSWLPIANLKIVHNIGCAYDEVTFFSCTSDSLELLRHKKNISEFQKTLPPDVTFDY